MTSLTDICHQLELLESRIRVLEKKIDFLIQDPKKTKELTEQWEKEEHNRRMEETAKRDGISLQTHSCL